MTKDETLKLALDALEGFIPYLPLKDEAQCNRYDKAITAIKEALAQRVVQVKPWEFNMMTQDKEDITGEPIAWSQWPNKEHNV